MAIQKISIEQFLALAKHYPIIDVRSPGEYKHAHIPGAHSLPLFNDEERKQVGTAYKQQSREKAIKIGVDFFGGKMSGMVDEAEKIVSHWQLANGKEAFPNKEVSAETEKKPLPIANCVLVHCWRGGMRSAGVAWLLDLYGFTVYTLVGGYKSYRKWVLEQFEKKYDFHIIGGYTGSGKTPLLRELMKQGQAGIDLEALANHKGSAFGAFGEQPQPRQEMFENMLAEKLFAERNLLEVKATSKPGNQQSANFIWVEDESQRIGNLQIPMPLWYTMRKSPVFFIDIPFEERLNYITEEYGRFEKEKLTEAIIRIKKRLGGLETKNAINHLMEADLRSCFSILLSYYDKWYTKGLYNRDDIMALLNKIPCTGVDTTTNFKKITACNVLSTS